MGNVPLWCYYTNVGTPQQWVQAWQSKQDDLGLTLQMVEALKSGIGLLSNAQNVLASPFKAPTDGITDCSQAFQAAINAAATASNASARIVYIPDIPNGYVIANTLYIPSSVLIKGDNLKGLQLSRIKPATGFTAPIFKSLNYGSARQLYIGIDGICIDGSNTTLTAIALNCQQSLLRDLTILDCYTYGIHIGGIGPGSTQQALNNVITDNYLAGTIGTTQFYDGIFLDYYTADTKLFNNYVQACSNAAIHSRAYNDTATGNHLYAAVYGFLSETSCDKVYSANYIELMSKNGMLFNGGASDQATLNAAIHGNIFRNINTAGTENGVIAIEGSNISSFSAMGNAIRSDAGTSYSTPYMVYLNGIGFPDYSYVGGSCWQSGVITGGECNESTAIAPTVRGTVSLAMAGGNTYATISNDLIRTGSILKWGVPVTRAAANLIPLVSKSAQILGSITVTFPNDGTSNTYVLPYEISI